MGIGSGIYVWKFRIPQTVVSPTTTTAVAATPTPKQFDLTTWNDEAGFSFQYPKELSVNKHEEDPNNYAHVELTNPNHPGKIIVWASDATKSWPPDGGTVIDTTLAGLPAKKVLVTTPFKTLSIGTISDGLLFNVEATLTDSEYWIRVQDTIVGSFAFTDNSPDAAAQQPSADEEEVVQ